MTRQERTSAGTLLPSGDVLGSECAGRQGALTFGALPKVDIVAKLAAPAVHVRRLRRQRVRRGKAIAAINKAETHDEFIKLKTALDAIKIN